MGQELRLTVDEGEVIKKKKKKNLTCDETGSYTLPSKVAAIIAHTYVYLYVFTSQ